MSALIRQSVLKPVQFNGQLCGRTIKVEIVICQRMLTAELESCKTSRSQGTPQLLLFVRLVAAETAGIAGGVHRRSIGEIILKWQPGDGSKN